MAPVLHRGDWYHKRGAVSDLCTTEWLKLDADEQKLFFPVKTLEDLGEQVRIPSAPPALPVSLSLGSPLLCAFLYRPGCISSSTIRWCRSSCRRFI